MLKKATRFTRSTLACGSTELAEVRDTPLRRQGCGELSLYKGWVG